MCSSKLKLLELGGFYELLVVKFDSAFAHMAFECGRVDDVVQLFSAPWAFTPWFAKASHWADEWGEDAGDDDGHSEKCSENRAAEHAANDQAHGRDDEAEKESAEGRLNWRIFMFSGKNWFRRLSPCSACGAEAPRRRELDAAFLALVGHWYSPPCG
jgi:hypothetical protein